MKNNILGIIGLTLLFSFIGLYFASNAGYIDHNSKSKSILTEKEIKRFEDDVRNNRPIDINNYVVDKEAKYNNKLSEATLKTSNFIGSVVEGALKFVLKNLDRAMNN